MSDVSFIDVLLVILDIDYSILIVSSAANIRLRKKVQI